jgi:hypothetical protein
MCVCVCVCVVIYIYNIGQGRFAEVAHAAILHARVPGHESGGSAA